MWRIAVVLIVLAGCGPTMVWREVSPQQVDAREQVFVVTTGHAYVFYVERMDPNVGIKGYAVRAWTFAPNGPFTVREDETPAAVARRLGWTEEQTWRAPRLIARRDIAYASKEKQLSNGGGFFFFPLFLR